MKPYYQHAGITIYHGDCREVLPELRMVDLVLTDPPYNVGCEYKSHQDDMTRGVYRAWCEDWFSMCRAVAMRSIIFPGHGNMQMWFEIRKPSGVGCWYKPGNPGHGALFQFCEWEPWFVWNTGANKPIAGGDAIRCPISNQPDTGDHPCPKPQKLFNAIIRKTHTESLIDPFMGSGTALKAAKELRKSAIGIEIEEKYCEIAAKRLSQEVFDFGETRAGSTDEHLGRDPQQTIVSGDEA